MWSLRTQNIGEVREQTFKNTRRQTPRGRKASAKGHRSEQMSSHRGNRHIRTMWKKPFPCSSFCSKPQPLLTEWPWKFCPQTCCDLTWLDRGHPLGEVVEKGPLLEHPFFLTHMTLNDTYLQKRRSFKKRRKVRSDHKSRRQRWDSYKMGWRTSSKSRAHEWPCSALLCWLWILLTFIFSRLGVACT